MIQLKKIIRNDRMRFFVLNCMRIIPDSVYLRIIFKIKSGKKLNLKTPTTFCDKLNWLKLFDKHEEYSDYVDKIAVRNIVREITGEDICFPILGCWSNYEEIDFSKLPNEFVLKCNHDSGSIKIVKDKSNINHKEFSKFFKSRLKHSEYVEGREYPYKNVKPKIFAERFMEDESGEDIRDYKFFCFDGKPEIMFVATDRNTDCRFDFFDMDFNHLDILNVHPQADRKIKKPSKFDEMKELSRKLSQGKKFVRVDLHEINGKIYFGEFTFFHAGGFWPMNPFIWEINLGNKIALEE